MAGLGDSMLSAVLRADDLARAKRFYTEVLGLKHVSSTRGGELFSAGGGGVVMVYERPGMPAPENTTLGFSVAADRFDAVMSELRANGVVFEEYDMPEIGLKTVGGVAMLEGEKAAWFKDTEGNILNIAVM